MHQPRSLAHTRLAWVLCSSSTLFQRYLSRYLKLELKLRGIYLTHIDTFSCHRQTCRSRRRQHRLPLQCRRRPWSLGVRQHAHEPELDVPLWPDASAQLLSVHLVVCSTQERLDQHRLHARQLAVGAVVHGPPAQRHQQRQQHLQRRCYELPECSLDPHQRASRTSIDAQCRLVHLIDVTHQFSNSLFLSHQDSWATINVGGSSVVFGNTNIVLSSSVVLEKVLFNFYQATSLNIYAVSVSGSILAPQAAVQFDDGNIDGSIASASFNGTGEIHLHPYIPPACNCSAYVSVSRSLNTRSHPLTTTTHSDARRSTSSLRGRSLRAPTSTNRTRMTRATLLLVAMCTCRTTPSAVRCRRSARLSTWLSAATCSSLSAKYARHHRRRHQWPRWAGH